MQHAMSYPAPKDDGPFENMCRAVKELFGAKHLQRFGRRGQAQLGIDLIGEADGGGAIAVQCKVRSGGALSFADIAADIESARQIQPPLTHFVVATTANRDAKLQQEIYRLDHESRAMGLFSIRVFFWDDFCELFDDRPDIARQIGLRIGSADLDRIDAHLVEVKGTLSVVARQTEISAVAAATEVDRDIDDAYRRSCDGDPKAAIAILEQIRLRDWDRLESRLRFRVLANLGSAHAMLGDLSVASDFYIRGRREHTSDRSRELEALAWHWRGDQARALQLAEELIADKSGSVVGHTIRIAAQIERLTVDQALTLVPAEFHAEPQVQSVLGKIARWNGDLERAISFARGAMKDAPDWIASTIELATLLLQRYAGTADARQESGSDDDGWAIEVEQLMTALLDRVGVSATTPALHQARFLRSIVRRRLHNVDAADEDLRSAYRGLPTDASIAASMALRLVSARQLGEALRVLEGVTEPRALRFHGFLAQVLADRNEPGDLPRAAQVLLAALGQETDEDPDVTFRCAKLLCDILVRLERRDEAWAIIADDGPLALTPAPARLALRAHVLIKADARSEATQTLRQVSAQSWRALRPPMRRLAFECMAELEMWREVYDILVDSAHTPENASDASYFIEAAAACGEHEMLLSFFRVHRSVIEPTRSHARIEAETLFEYGEYDAGIAALTQWLEANPSDAEARLWRSAAAFDVGRDDLVQTEAAQLPDPKSCDPALGLRAVLFWGSTPDAPWEDVRQYAYTLWRRAPDNIDACHALVAAHFLAVAAKSEATPLTEVGLDSSVQLRLPSGEDLWLTIESDVQGHMPDHHGATDEVTQAILGARVGETRELPAGMLGPTRVTVEQVVRPFTYHAHEVAAAWDRRFPSRPVVSLMHTPSPPEDATHEEAEAYLHDLKKVVRRDAERREAREKPLADLGWPRHLLGQALGKSVFAATAYLAGRADRTLHSCAGTTRERRQAEQAVQRSRAVMIDVTALATLALLGRMALLSKLRIRLVTTQSTLVALRRHIRECATSSEMSVAWHEGEFVVLRDEPRAREQYVLDLETGVAALQASAEVVGGAALTSSPAQVRNVLDRGLGSATAQAAAVAAKHGIPLWTDDRSVAEIARSTLGADTIWTGLLLQIAERGGDLTQAEVDDMLGRMYVLGYRHTSLRPTTVVEALRRANWSVEDPFAKALLDSFGDQATSQASLMEYAMGTLARLWAACPLLESRCVAARAMLRSIDARADGRRIGVAMRRCVDAAFGLNVLAAGEVHGLLSAWLATPRSITSNRTMLLGPDGSPL